MSVEIRRKSDILEPTHYPHCEDTEVAKIKTPDTTPYETVLPKLPAGCRSWSSPSTPKGSAQPPSLLISVSSPTINIEHQFSFSMPLDLNLDLLKYPKKLYRFIYSTHGNENNSIRYI